MVTVTQSRQKDWVRTLFVPYVVFFALSCAISGLSMVVKMQIIRQKFSSRHSAADRKAAVSPTSRPPPQVNPVDQATALAEAKVGAHR